MDNVYEKLVDCLGSVRRETDFVPEVAVILGSGLGEFAEGIKRVAAIDYEEIDGFPMATVDGHAGRFVFGYVGEVPVVVMQGRIHYYEGYPMSDVVLPVRLMGMLGAKVLLSTNAAGGIREDLKPGDLMLITDQIAQFVPSPLIGQNIDELGVRFPDMSHIYDEGLRTAVKAAAKNVGVSLKEGVYIQFTGPAYESPAEIRMARAMGADAVGMSTACENVAAVHMGMRVCGISSISNMAAGISPVPLSHAEVKAAGDRVAATLGKLLKESIIEIHKII